MPGNVLSILIDIPLITTIKNWDRWLFSKINYDWTTGFLDNVFPLFREAITWVPLYIFLLILMFTNFGAKAWPWVIGLIVTVTLTDQVSSHLIKPFVNRLRPCHDPYLEAHIRLLLQYCSDSRSFTSSHATNHFGVAFFISRTMKPHFGRWRYAFFAWAAAISYGQMYIGVHYPTDIIGGALVGSLIGYLTSSIFIKKIGIPQLRDNERPAAAI